MSVEDPWLYVSITTQHHEVAASLNPDHRCNQISPPSRGSTPFHDDANPDDGAVFYSLSIKQAPEYVFGTDATADFRLEEPTMSSLLSARHFKLYFNENQAWMLQDLSTNGVVLNELAMCSPKRQAKMAERNKSIEVLDRAALRPDTWNHIDTRKWQLQIRVGYSQPSRPLDPNRIDLSYLALQYQPTETADSDFSEIMLRSHSFSDRYYRLERETEPVSKLSLMRISDGKLHTGHPHDLNKSHVRSNYQRCLGLNGIAHSYNVLPYVDAGIFDDYFVTVTEAWDGKYLSDVTLTLEELTFVFTRLLRSTAFLHDQGFGCKISLDDTLVRLTGRYEGKSSMQELPITTNVHIDLDRQTSPISRHDKNENVRAIHSVIIECLSEKKIKWETTPINRYLQACLATVQPEEQHLAHSILSAMNIDRPDKLSWPFNAPIRIRRTFPLLWRQGNPRLKEIHQIIRACGAPRTPLIAPSSSIDGEYFIDYNKANKLLRRHAIPGLLEQNKEFYSYTRSIFRHAASGLCNISQVFEICADWPLPENFRTPTTIREVRGSGEWDGFYVDKISFDAVIAYLVTCCSLAVKVSTDLKEERVTSVFDAVDHQSSVAIFTECSTPQLVQLSRKVRSWSPSSDLQFPTVEECFKWFSLSGLTAQADRIRNLRQPFPADWTQVVEVESTGSRLSESPYSPTKFRFGRWKSRLLRSNHEDDETTIPPIKPTISQEIISWQEKVSHDDDDSDASQASTIRLRDHQHNFIEPRSQRYSDDKAAPTEFKLHQPPERKKAKSDATTSDVILSAIERTTQRERDKVGDIQTAKVDEDFIHDTIELPQHQADGHKDEQIAEIEPCAIKGTKNITTTVDATMQSLHRRRPRQCKADQIKAIVRPVLLTRGIMKEQQRKSKIDGFR